ALVVSGQHRDVDALARQGGDDLADLGTELVTHPDRPGERAVAVDDDDRHPLGLQVTDPVGEVAGVDPAGAADQHYGAVDGAVDSVAGFLGGALGGGDCGGGVGDGGGE